MRSYVLLASVVLAGILAFSSRAVYLDEHIYLQIARSAQTNRLFPQETAGIFFGTPKPDFASHTHPPVGEYYLALIYGLVGEFREAPFRILFSIFAVGAVLGFYYLAKRFTSQPFWVALLFAMSPAFFLYSPTLMMDMPMLAFLLAGFSLYFAHLQGRPGLLPFASLCFVLAAGTGYTALVPLFCFFLGLLAARRPLKELLSVAAAPAVLAFWLTAMTIHFGEFPLAGTAEYYLASNASAFRNVLAALGFIGAVGIFPWLAGSRLSAAIGIPAVSLLTLLYSWPSLEHRLWFIFLASSGVALLLKFTKAARALVASGKNNGEAFLILWVPAALLFFVLVADMINGRYILLALPALYLVIFRDASRNRLVYTLVPTAALSLSLAYSDLLLVNANRELVETTVVPLQQQGFRIWSAAESGLRFYLEQRGIDSLSTQDVRPGPGDLVVRHRGIFRYALSEKVETMLTTLETFTLTDAFPVRTYSAAAGAGFHDSGAGLVPFTFSLEPFDRVEVSQVSPLTPAAVWSPDGPIFQQDEPEREFTVGIPSGTRIEFEVDGDGSIDVIDDRIRLINQSSSRIVWKNFRIVPNQFVSH